ncbi:hypothetical protein FE257_001707 [Aspergillus nanangensis]|uniref:Major facilitator superfamily (MFS) profile domain-containing protein n=1 Tax=Aspergillus nanangensis TaxID=2582783 RepID=A0AAD4GNT4_ASPNN|nr:hypothetical protein FE257_001707 [Aspergillus nanangensis]
MFENLRVERKVHRPIEGEESSVQPNPHTTSVNILTIIASASASFTFGYTNNTISGSLVQKSFNEYFLSGSNTDSLIGGVMGGFYAAALFGAIVQSEISQLWGRKHCTLVAAILVVVSSVLQAAAVHIAMFLVGRVIAGTAAGILLSNTPVYMSEISPAHTRGRMVSAHGMTITFSYTVCAPRWLLDKGHTEEAWAVLKRLHSSGNDTRIAHAEFAQMNAQINKEKTLETGYVSIFKNGSTRKRAICGGMVWFMGQSTGVLCIANFSPVLFQGLGFDNTLQLGLAAAWLVVCQVGTVFGCLLIERVGRVKLLVIGAYSMALCLLMEALLQMRYLGATIGITSFFATTICFSTPASLAFKNIGWKYYLVFVCLSIVSATFMLFYAPETAGLTLEEVAARFGDEVVGMDVAIGGNEATKPETLHLEHTPEDIHTRQSSLRSGGENPA